MRPLTRRLIERWQLFSAAEAATAAIEFALILPIMLVLYVGTVEIGSLITIDRKVQSVAGALGDLVARSNETISPGALQDYFGAAGGIMTPYSSATLTQVVTQVEVRADGSAWVDWSRQYTNGLMSVGTRYLEDTEFTLAQEMVDLALGQYVIVSEANYSYDPMFNPIFDLVGMQLNEPISLFRQNFYMPRFGSRIQVQ